MLIVGGIVLLFVDRIPLAPRYHSAYDIPPARAFGIGLCPVPGYGPRRVAVGLDDRRRDAAWHR